MVSRFAFFFATVLCASSAALAEASPVLPLVSHRAAYDISLADSTGPTPSSAQTPISAAGLIAYEFRGSACEGYTSNFHQMTHRRSGRTRSRSKTPRSSKPGRPSPQKKTELQTRVFPAWRALTAPQKRGQCAGS